MKVVRVAKSAPPAVRAWTHFIGMAGRNEHTRLPLITNAGNPTRWNVTLGALLAIVGRPEDTMGQRAFAAYRELFLAPKRNASTALSRVPPVREKIWRLVECVEAFHRYVERPGRRGSPTYYKLDLTPLVEVMLQIPTPDVYVRSVVKSTLTQSNLFPVVFHPNVFDHVKDTDFRLDLDVRGKHREHIAHLREKLDEIVV